MTSGVEGRLSKSLAYFSPPVAPWSPEIDFVDWACERTLPEAPTVPIRVLGSQPAGRAEPPVLFVPRVRAPSQEPPRSGPGRKPRRELPDPILAAYARDIDGARYDEIAEMSHLERVIVTWDPPKYRSEPRNATYTTAGKASTQPAPGRGRSQPRTGASRTTGGNTNGTPRSSSPGGSLPPATRGSGT